MFKYWGIFKMKANVPQPTGLIGEFVAFVTKSNAIALAIGVILGGAATKLVTAVVDNILNPLIGAVLGGANLNDALMIPLGKALVDGKEVPNYIKIGALFSSVIDFVAVMLVMFLIIKALPKNLTEEKK